MSRILDVKIKDIKEKPEEFVGKELVIEGEIDYLGHSPREESFTINFPSEREYDVFTVRDDSGVILALASPHLDLKSLVGKKIKIIGILKRINKHDFFLKIIEILDTNANQEISAHLK